MKSRYKKLGENENISLYFDKNEENGMDGFIVFDKKTGEMVISNPTDPQYGKDITEILLSIHNEEDEDPR